MRITLTVNGDRVEQDVPPNVLLVDLLRDTCELTGAKVGCDTGQCGTCVVRLGDRSVKSCQMLAVQADGAEVTTVEGLSGDGELTPLQEALWEEHGAQCGFCVPGMVMSLTDLLERDSAPDEQAIRAGIAGNLCRCTGYGAVVRAVQKAVKDKS
ncbi:(2Fe-2S)-binding protein [Streptosporangium pseudovulgare]|uniref:Carbon monoxide dehydrogenase n=1 Tax=Streptosporangium pseudovulgare TaxID=35765 RepID=A0ABQ2RJA0_9ACTN|nr:(2Fe-2S)-binding protein [Streptosporangium pseudovulgare]GGQ34076.1 carbon monoxide dehydrogenase [Streptosporangium pseudovulgare]